MTNTKQQTQADALTPDQMRWVCGTLWAELRLGPQCWDRPLNPTRKHAKTVGVKCGRCNGVGAIASFSVKYSGKCFACGGSGVRFVSLTEYERRKRIEKRA